MTSLVQITLLAILAVLASQLQGSDACRCIRSHPQSEFCRSNWVVKVTVKKSDRTANARNFIVNVDTTYKLGSPAAKKAFEKSPATISTPLHSCGLRDLKTGEKFILSGSMAGDTPSIMLCDMKIAGAAITPQLEQHLKDQFSKGCNCEVVNEVPNKPAGKNQCSYSFSQPGECQRQFGVCSKTGDACAWQSSPDYNKCIGKKTE